MRRSVLSGAFLLAILFGSPLSAADPVEAKESLFISKLKINTKWAATADGELSIFVELSQSEVVKENEETILYIYTMYFYDHIFQDGVICGALSGAEEFPNCASVSQLQKAPSEEVQNMGVMLKEHFVKEYEEKVRSDVEKLIREELEKRLRTAPPEAA